MLDNSETGSLECMSAQGIAELVPGVTEHTFTLQAKQMRKRRNLEEKEGVGTRSDRP